MKFINIILAVTFFFVVGCSEDSTGPEVDKTLNAPSELKVTRIGKTAVRLLWKDNTAAEEGFVVERKQAQQDYTPYLFTTKNSTTAVDSVGLIADSTYSYRVQAIRYLERGEYSNVVSIKLALPFP
ncbi:MAG: fibronectin type III domain-containing protein [Ignavibacteriales bacterium]|nr:fibronectin type III domain-containing protein [Ignavibacteriales bacterium]